jgi:DNA-binding transcriptional MerR regulator
MAIMNDNVLTLKQIQKKLQTKQHVLIHLCEKGVIEPDYQQTEGRGLHREFSQRNLFEFAVALTIRKYGIPVSTTAAIIRLLKSFERSAQRSLKGFNLLDYLRDANQKLDIHLILYDGEYMIFGLQKAGKLLSATGFDLKKIVAEPTKPLKLDKLDDLPIDFDSYLNLDLKRIAKRTV